MQDKQQKLYDKVAEVQEIKEAEASFENDADLNLDDDVIEKANKKKKTEIRQDSEQPV